MSQEEAKKKAEEMAKNLEAMAAELREKGLTEEDLDRINAGADGDLGSIECCGSDCQMVTSLCSSPILFNCKKSCIASSPN